MDPPHLSWWSDWGSAEEARWAKTGNTPLTDHCSGTKKLRGKEKNTHRHKRNQDKLIYLSTDNNLLIKEILCISKSPNKQPKKL